MLARQWSLELQWIQRVESVKSLDELFSPCHLALHPHALPFMRMATEWVTTIEGGTAGSWLWHANKASSSMRFIAKLCSKAVQHMASIECCFRMARKWPQLLENSFAVSGSLLMQVSCHESNFACNLVPVATRWQAR